MPAPFPAFGDKNTIVNPNCGLQPKFRNAVESHFRETIQPIDGPLELQAANVEPELFSTISLGDNLQYVARIRAASCRHPQFCLESGQTFVTDESGDLVALNLVSRLQVEAQLLSTPRLQQRAGQ